MGINSQNVSYGFGQMGSGHIKEAASDLIPPHGRVIVAIQMLDTVSFSSLVADTSGASTLVDETSSPGDGIAFIGTQDQTRANGLENSNNTVESVKIATSVAFLKGTTIYGRWTRVSLNADSTHGIICYYGE